MTDLMNHEAVYRTAPATPGLLKNYTNYSNYKNVKKKKKILLNSMKLDATFKASLE